MNLSRRFLKADMNVQTVMLSIQLLVALLAFTSGGGVMLWVPVITFFLGVYQWAISAMIHITGLRYTPEPIKKWRQIHIIGSVVYLAFAIAMTMMTNRDYYFILWLIGIPQLIGFAYYGLTIWDYRLYNTYRDNVG
ncbi:hypothetical protein [uncultured Microscilla sp.]|uniref:hypothetical protein n=1 Tax=uncultured Microscilla sp. TaxID=432653 RepID=UPI002634AD56|nr:hypothetical protein [uncultured Microscilla sp.]